MLYKDLLTLGISKSTARMVAPDVLAMISGLEPRFAVELSVSFEELEKMNEPSDIQLFVALAS